MLRRWLKDALQGEPQLPDGGEPEPAPRIRWWVTLLALLAGLGLIITANYYLQDARESSSRKRTSASKARRTAPAPPMDAAVNPQQK